MEKNKQKAIIIDLDFTLFDASHRLKDDGGMVYEGMTNDTVNEWCKEIVNKFKDTYHIVYLTGRMTLKQNDTIESLRQEDLLFPNSYLVMRGTDDHSPSQEYKRNAYKKYVEPKFDVLFAIDDEPNNVTMWNELGIKGLQC